MASRPPTRSAAHRGPALFRSARSSTDLPLIAFAAILLAAFVAHAGAFLPRLLRIERPQAEAAVVRTEEAPAASARPLAREVARRDPPGVPRG